jgi:hypothetical protein
MDLFAVIILGGIASVVVVLLAIGRFSARRPTDIANENLNEIMGARAAIEDRDIGEMVDGQNDYRRRHGKRAITESEVRRRVGSEELGRLDRADAEARAEGR